ncbi:complex I intermediate-associated protein 30-domain-containing protein [Globomyces pollinis-pini]|nr:complex I intermediate-associated protein 30-domain-containing protein [Globomyces pollinis-pini]
MNNCFNRLDSWVVKWFVFFHCLDFTLASITQKTLLVSVPLPLFGGQIGWKFKHWETVDDRIRGGVSISNLVPIQHDTLQTARFYGTLDPSILNAGFASQRFIFQQPLDASAYSGVRLTILSSDQKTFSLNLLNSYPKDRGDGRKESMINFKAVFEPSPNSIIELRWKDFKGSNRGRPTNDQLNLSNITGCSLMLQSFFGKQSGDFDLTIQKIELFK